jgi:hypothetical protein
MDLSRAIGLGDNKTGSKDILGPDSEYVLCQVAAIEAKRPRGFTGLIVSEAFSRVSEPTTTHKSFKPSTR